MAQDSFSVKAVIDADTRGFNQGMKSVSGGLRIAGGSFSRMGAVGVASMAAIAVAAAAVGVAIVAAFAIKSTKAFIEFEEQMVKTAAIMGQKVVGDIKHIEDEVLRLSATTRNTATQLAEAAQILALAGFSDIEMVDKKALENLNALAIAAGVEVPVAAAVAISSLKGMGMETEELNRVNDVLLNTMTSTFTSIETLGESMKFLAPTAKAAGISIEEAAAAAGILGNAGLQGSMAGTAMRMAITKLLKPTDDARKLMMDLGLSFFTLSPKGEAATVALRAVNSELVQSRLQAEGTNAALKSLNDELSDMSLDQQRNNLVIMQIRRRAEKEGRSLTEKEIAQIARLEGANADLGISMAERQIEQQVASKASVEANAQVVEQEKLVRTLNKTIFNQTTGLTSLSDVFNQLSTSGATTSQILQIFGVRGGTAANAMLTQVDAFNELIESNNNAQEAFGGLGKTMGMVETMNTSTAASVFLMKSAWETFMIDVGREFGPMLKDDILPAVMDLIVGLKPLIPVFGEMAKQIGDNMPEMIEMLIPFIEQMAHTFKLLLPIIGLLIKFMQWFMIFFEPVIRMISEFSAALLALLDGDIAGFFDHLLGGFGALIEVVMPLWRAVKAIATVLGFGDELSDAGAAVEEKTGFNMESAAAGAGIGFVVGGPVGAAVGGAIGGFLFEQGGIVSGPTHAIIGEAGPEAVIPVDRLTGLVSAGVRQGMDGSGSGGGGGKVVIHGGIHIGAGNNLNKRDVESAINSVLPKILLSGSMRGASKVI